MTFEAFAETTEYRKIVKIISALSTQDERIVEELRAKFYGPTVQGGKRRERVIKIGGHLPIGFNISLEEFAESIETRAWESVARQNWLPFEEARAFVCKRGLKSVDEWRAYSKSGERPANIPGAPHDAYAEKGWTNWGDWLGTGNVRTKTFLPFEEARAFVHKLGLNSQTEWHAYSKSGKPANIPTNPYDAYAENGWTNWGDWLGTGNVPYGTVSFLPFKEARSFAHKLGLKGQTEWRAYSKSGERPANIPTNPNRTYAGKGWTNWGDWLGTGTKRTTSDEP